MLVPETVEALSQIKGPIVVVSVVGTQRGGKSTLLNILGLLDNPTAGEYHFGEHEVAKYSERQRAQLRARPVDLSLAWRGS